MSRWQYIGGVALLLLGLLSCGDDNSETSAVVDTEQSDVHTDTNRGGGPVVGNDVTAPPEDTGASSTDTGTTPVDTAQPDAQEPEPDVPLADTQQPQTDTVEMDTQAPPMDTAVADSEEPVSDTTVIDTQAPPVDVPPPTDDVAPMPEDAKTADVPMTPTEPETSEGKVGQGTPVDILPPPPEPLPRAKKRVNIDQLLAALAKTTGMTSWVNNPKNMIEANADTLGRPDYETSMSENRVPGLFFDKLLGDSARDICTQLMAKEKAALPEERIFIKHAALNDTSASAPEQIAQNMRMLLLRFHGTYIAAKSPQLEPWLTLFDVATNDTETPNPVNGWAVVCTTLLVHPDFISY